MGRQRAAFMQHDSTSSETIYAQTERPLPDEHGEIWFKALLEAAPDAIVAVDHDGQIVLVNEQAEYLFGYTRHELIGRHVEVLLPALDRILRRCDQDEGWSDSHGLPLGPGIELTAVRQDGSEFPVEMSLSPLQTPDGHWVTSIIRDVTERKRAEEHARFLMEVSALLSESLDYEVAVARLAHLAVPMLGDWCSVNLATDNGSISRLASHHADPAKTDLVRHLCDRYPPRPSDQAGAANVLRTGKPEFYSRIPASFIETIAQDAEHRALLSSVGLGSGIIMPLRARGQVLGTISFTAATPDRFTLGDMVLAAELASRAALALDNARLYRVRQEAEARAREHAARVGALAEAANRIIETGLDQKAVVETIAQQIVDLVGECCAILLLSEDGKSLKSAVFHHPDPHVRVQAQRILPTLVPLDEELSGQVLRSGVPLRLPDAEAVRRVLAGRSVAAEYLEQHEIQTALIVPVVARTRAVGTLVLWRETRSEPYTDSDVHFVQSLADRAALAIDNARLYQAAQDIARAREEFLAIAGHEVLTPLTSIKGFAQMLAKQARESRWDRERIFGYSHEIEHQADRLETLVRDLLETSRVQHTHMEIRTIQMDITALARQVLERFEHIPDRRPDHALIFDAGDPVVGQWDPARLEQALFNLISNALKYSPDGGEVTVSVGTNGNQAMIQVRDHGIGVAAEDWDQLFEPFARTEQARRTADGAGLGLYLTKQIVERYGGTLTVESELEVGSTFTVRLPLPQPEGDSDS
jgi:PAS domain S-box-containing protein